MRYEQLDKKKHLDEVSKKHSLSLVVEKLKKTR